MTMRQLFATPLYEADLALDLAELAHSIRSLAEDDGAGRRWAKEHGYKGYTSYASLNDLPRRDPVFADLAKALTRHAATFARDLAWEVKPKLDSLWVNVLKPGGHHSAHIHPHSILSGTLYIDVPDGAGAIRFEDPRLPMMMAAPIRGADAPEPLRPFVTLHPLPGQLLLWESWLRHEVLPGNARGERLSVSFNFA
ncbi:TIGR02466 family protein [Sphingomonas glaciei]|uniref:TIGR02466 family protein n=1 Tax=Sphingomonas glaciei TaxID=2938948 RepID=A0ABY5N064_9SPHN|nr:TIGR02466 family protein [Sphingomonas glaciei]UUR09435.1 TIGR02466 family protein [Sphingomonas glaciei]